MKYLRIALILVIMSTLSPSFAFINIQSALQTKARLSLTGQTEVKIIHRQTRFGTQIKIWHVDKEFQTWQVAFGPIMEKQYYWVSLMNTYQLHEVLGFNIKKINPLYQYLISEATLKPQIGIFTTRITYRYYFADKNTGKQDFSIKEIELRKASNFIGKGYTGLRIIMKDNSTFPYTRYLDIQINSWRIYGSSLDYLRFTLGYKIQFENTKALPNDKIYLSMRMEL